METKIAIRGLKHTYKLYHITDLHLTRTSEADTQARREEAALRARCIFEADGQDALTRLEGFYEDARAWGADLMLMTGDMVDMPSESNVRALHGAVAQSGMDTFFVIGNHDWSFSDDYHTPAARQAHYARFEGLSEGCVARHYREYEDFILAGIDNGMECVQDEDVAFLQALAGREKPIVLCMHIPVTCPSLVEDTVRDWRRDINIGPGAICKNNATAAFCAYIRTPASHVAAVIAGHLHFSHEDELASGLVQYVTGGAHRNIARKITLVPEN